VFKGENGVRGTKPVPKGERKRIQRHNSTPVINGGLGRSEARHPKVTTHELEKGGKG